MAKNVWACLNSRQHFFCFSFSNISWFLCQEKHGKTLSPKTMDFSPGSVPVGNADRPDQTGTSLCTWFAQVVEVKSYRKSTNHFFFFAWTFFQSHIILLQVCLIQLVDVFISHTSLTRQHRVADVGNKRSCNWRVLGRQGLDPHVVWCWMFFVRPIPRSS